MANNQKRERLGQPARDTLSVLDKALLDLAIDTQEKQPNEFTINDLIEQANGSLQASAMKVKARKLVSEGKWKVRCLRGTKLYSKA